MAIGIPGVSEVVHSGEHKQHNCEWYGKNFPLTQAKTTLSQDAKLMTNHVSGYGDVQK